MKLFSIISNTGRVCRHGLYALALATAFTATAVVIPSESDYVRSLDGTWRFKLEQPGGYDAKSGNGNRPIAIKQPAAIDPAQNLDYQEGNGWTNLPVPGNWEMAGLSPATYKEPDNASGFYRVWFDVPQAWQGRLVRLDFDGVQNGAEIWLNGQPVAVDEPSWGRQNYHESGWTAFQADLTPQVKFGGKNLLAVRVTKNTRSVNLDTGDYFLLGGIYRTVTLFSIPKTHLADLTVQTRLLAGGKAEVKVIADVAGESADSVAMRLEGVAGQPVAKVEHGKAVLAQMVSQPKLWSAEFPNLYALTLELKDAQGQVSETITRRIGIREVSVKDGVLLVNGVPVKLAGICRHDVSATEGSAVGPALWRKDITMMKAANINAIRTSHYPYGAGFYALCDELGIYVVNELPYCWCANDADDPKMDPAFAQRVRETLRRDKNHPSVIIWAVGNENFKPVRPGLRAAADLVKAIDNTRPRLVSCWDAADYATEISDKHYRNPDVIAKDAAHARETGHPFIYTENPNTWDIRLAADASMYECWGAVMQRSWEACYKYDTVPGTFPFEWQDRAVADACPTKLYSYYPETGIQLKKIKGLVDAFRNPRPSLFEMKMACSPLQISNALTLASGTVSFPIENRYSFTDLSLLKLAWRLERDGKAVASGDTHITQPPRSAGRAELSLPAEALAQADALRVEFIHPDGNNVVGHRFRLKSPPPASRLNAALPAGLPLPQFNLITRETKKDEALWRKTTRFPAHLAQVVVAPASATTLAQLKQLDAAVVSGKGQVVGRLHAQFAGNQFSYRLDWTGPKADVQELGWTFSLPQTCDHFSWERAARWTLYPEHHLGRPAGTATPDTMNVPVTRMDRPGAFDFNSTKYDCNWATLAGADGAGLRVEFQPEQRFHCRAGLPAKGPGYVLYVNQKVSPPDDLSKSVVPDFYLTLKPGDTIEGRFRVGSNQSRL